MSIPPKVSIIIPTYNGADTLQGCLASIFNQDTDWPFDVHIVDSGSTDGSLEIIQQFPVQLTQIPNSAFSHGGTRNQAASRVSGEYIVFLVQDAEPVGTDWLTTLVSATESLGAVGAFGSQEARPKASLYTKWVMSRVLPDSPQSVLKCLGPDRNWAQLSPHERYNLAFFHNGNSCIRREIMLRFPFQPMPYGEDMEWAKRVLIAGHAIVYEPRAWVLHSHDRSWVYEFKRAYSDHTLVKELFELELIDRPVTFVRYLAWSMLHSARWALNYPAPLPKKLLGAADASLLAGAQVLGTYLGSRAVTWMSKYPSMVKLDRRLRRGV